MATTGEQEILDRILAELKSETRSGSAFLFIELFCIKNVTFCLL
jgi:hypothetical protein